MRPPFGATSPSELARRMALDPRWSVEEFYVARTGRLPRPLDEYPALIVAALFGHGRDALEQARRQAEFEDEVEQAVIGGARTRQRMGPPTPGPKKIPTGGWQVPRLTGDPVGDAWERAIARGEDPDLEAR